MRFVTFVCAFDVFSSDWLGTEFISSHREHDTNLTKSLKHSAALSEAASLASLLRDWIKGTPENETTSLGVYCAGSIISLMRENS